MIRVSGAVNLATLTKRTKNAMDALPADHMLLFYFTLGLGIFMAWGIGANDFANSAGPAVGAKVLGFREAVFIVVLFEIGGALLYGSHVNDTFRWDVIDIDHPNARNDVLLYGMLASLLAAGLWLTLASARGWPVSTTHSILGALVGFALVAMGSDSVQWDNIGSLLTSWVLSPIVGGLLAYLLMKSVRVLILNPADSVAASRRWVPMYVFLAAFVACLMTFFKTMRPLGLDLTFEQSLLLAAIFGLSLSVMGVLFVRSRGVTSVEQAFEPITLFAVCSMAFAHGSNDVANSVGPMAVGLEVLGMRGTSFGYQGPPFWLFAIGGIGVAVGMATFGFRVGRTLGKEITALSPCRAFCIVLAATATVVLASRAGFPVSTTHTVVGAVLGVGLTSGTDAVNLPVVKTIVKSWLVTIPLTATLAALLYPVLRFTLGT